MTNNPLFPFDVEDYITTTRHLTSAQHGAVLLLMFTSWKTPNCELPNDDKFLARCAAMDMRVWKANKDTIMSFFQKTDSGNYYSLKAQMERKNVAQLSQKNSINSKARWLNNNNTDNAVAIPSHIPKDDFGNPRVRAGVYSLLDIDSSSEFNDEEEKELKETTKEKKKKDLLVLPDWLDREIWQAYLQTRKTKKAASTDRALSAVLRKAESFGRSPTERNKVLEQSIISGWTDVYPLKDQPIQQKGKREVL